jgi:hypothetical protein
LVGRGNGEGEGKVRKRRGKEGQVGAGEELDKRGWWGGHDLCCANAQGWQDPGRTHSPANAMATLAAGWVARPHQTVEPLLPSIGRTILH